MKKEENMKKYLLFIIPFILILASCGTTNTTVDLQIKEEFAAFKQTALEARNKELNKEQLIQKLGDHYNNFQKLITVYQNNKDDLTEADHYKYNAFLLAITEYIGSIQTVLKVNEKYIDYTMHFGDMAIGQLEKILNGEFSLPEK
jgi:hypothetical protein